jgi:hypothetical protein
LAVTHCPRERCSLRRLLDSATENDPIAPHDRLYRGTVEVTHVGSHGGHVVTVSTVAMAQTLATAGTLVTAPTGDTVHTGVTAHTDVTSDQVRRNMPGRCSSKGNTALGSSKICLNTENRRCAIRANRRGRRAPFRVHIHGALQASGAEACRVTWVIREAGVRCSTAVVWLGNVTTLGARQTTCDGRVLPIATPHEDGAVRIRTNEYSGHSAASRCSLSVHKGYC